MYVYEQNQEALVAFVIDLVVVVLVVLVIERPAQMEGSIDFSSENLYSCALEVHRRGKTMCQN